MIRSNRSIITQIARSWGLVLLLGAATGSGAQDLDTDDLHVTLPAGSHILSGTVTITGDLVVPNDAR